MQDIRSTEKCFYGVNSPHYYWKTKWPIELIFLYFCVFADGMELSTCLKLLDSIKQNAQGAYKPKCTTDGMFEKKQVCG